MPDRTELLRGLRLGDDSVLECREVRFAGGRIERPGRDRLADELAAFANAAGGVVVLGVSDEPCAVTGIPIEHLDAVERHVSGSVLDAITPPLAPLIEKLELPDAEGRMRPVLRIEVPRGLSVHQSPGGYLHRVGGATRQMKPAVLGRLFAQRGQVGPFDRRVVEEASLDDLDARCVDRFLTESDDDRTTALAKLDMVGEDDAGVLRPTVAGVLFGTRQPQRWLPQAFIQSVAYRGVSVGSAMDLPRYQLDAKDNDGPLDEQIEYACRFVARNQRVEASKYMGRRDWPQYDLTAVFEAIVNAVVHRDYSTRGSKVRLQMFSDRIELHAPGPLSESMTVDALHRRWTTRNPAIADLLARCPVPDWIESPCARLMNRRGEGVPLILERCERLSGRAPFYDRIGDAELMLTIYAAYAVDFEEGRATETDRTAHRLRPRDVPRGRVE